MVLNIIFFLNNPLSDKWNYGLSMLRKHKFKYLMILGSDDIISSNLLNRLINIMDNDNYDMCGLLDIYFYDINDDIGVHWTGYDEKSGRLGETVGAGRFYTKKLVEYFNYKLWTDGKNSVLDLDVSKRIKNFKIYSTNILHGEYIIDMKGGDEQITNFSFFKNCKKINIKNIKI